MSRRGGIARAKKLSPEQRQEIASYAGKMAATKRRLRKAKPELETHTDQRPNRLIDVVDKLIARNGRDRK